MKDLYHTISLVSMSNKNWYHFDARKKPWNRNFLLLTSSVSWWTVNFWWETLNTYDCVEPYHNALCLNNFIFRLYRALMICFTWHVLHLADGQCWIWLLHVYYNHIRISCAQITVSAYSHQVRMSLLLRSITELMHTVLVTVWYDIILSEINHLYYLIYVGSV